MIVMALIVCTVCYERHMLSVFLMHALFLSQVSAPSMNSDKVAYWHCRIVNIAECIPSDRVSLLCDFLLRNDFVAERGLRHASDPSFWEGSGELSEGMNLAVMCHEWVIDLASLLQQVNEN